MGIGKRVVAAAWGGLGLGEPVLEGRHGVMAYWRWNAGLSSEEIREQVWRGLFQRNNARATGPSCSLVPEAQQQERRLQPDRRQGTCGAWLPRQERRTRGERRRYGAESA
jgi:hypothetical protein